MEEDDRRVSWGPVSSLALSLGLIYSSDAERHGQKMTELFS